MSSEWRTISLGELGRGITGKTPKTSDDNNQIVDKIIFKTLGNHEQAQTLATLRDTLLPRLISGQLRLPEAEAMLESA